MAILNKTAFAHAKQLINDGKYIVDDRDNWKVHQPTLQQENQYIKDHGYTKYGNWYLSIDEAELKNAKGRYKFPYGDFYKVHSCGVLAAESRAGQYKFFDIERAAAHLHVMLIAK